MPQTEYKESLDNLRKSAERIIAGHAPDKEQQLKDMTLEMSRLQHRLLTALHVGWVAKK
jgi:hypothetical protein